MLYKYVTRNFYLRYVSKTYNSSTLKTKTKNPMNKMDKRFEKAFP